MGASDVDRLRADLAVLDRRIDRIEKSAAIATAGFTTVRQKLDALETAPRGGRSVLHGETYDGDVLVDLKTELAALRDVVRTIGERVERLEVGLEAARSDAESARARPDPEAESLAELRGEIAQLRTEMKAAEKPTDDPSASLREEVERLGAEVAALRDRPVAPVPPAPEDPQPSGSRGPRRDTLPEGMLASGVSRDDPQPLANASWGSDRIQLDTPIMLRCEARGHFDEEPVKVTVLGADDDEVACLDAAVSSERIQAVWRYRYEDDPNTERTDPRFRFRMRAGTSEAESALIPVASWAPPPKKLGFSDMLRRKG